MLHIISHSGKYKIKSQSDTASHLLKWLKLKMLTTPTADREVGQLELSYMASGNASVVSTTTSESKLAIYHEVYTYMYIN